MRGDLRAVSVRSLPRIPRLDLSQRLTSPRRRRYEGRQARLEVIERLDRIERDTRRAGDGTPDVTLGRRWC